MRYNVIEFSDNSYLDELKKSVILKNNCQSINDVKADRLINHIEFKYEGKSACIYKGNVDIENFFLLYRIYLSLANITYRHGYSEIGTVIEYSYAIKIYYHEMILLKLRALFTLDRSIERPREIILSHVSMLNEQLIINLGTASNIIEAVTFNHYDIKLDDWFEVRPLLAEKLPKLWPNFLIEEKPIGLDFARFWNFEGPHVFVLKNNKIQYDIIFKNGSYPEEKNNNWQICLKLIGKGFTWLWLFITFVVLLFLSGLMLLKKIFLNSRFIQTMFASATGLWLLQNIAKFSWRHLF